MAALMAASSPSRSSGCTVAMICSSGMPLRPSAGSMPKLAANPSSMVKRSVGRSQNQAPMMAPALSASCTRSAFTRARSCSVAARRSASTRSVVSTTMATTPRTVPSASSAGEYSRSAHSMRGVPSRTSVSSWSLYESVPPSW